jgi:hypothetical protein
MQTNSEHEPAFIILFLHFDENVSWLLPNEVFKRSRIFYFSEFLFLFSEILNKHFNIDSQSQVFDLYYSSLKWRSRI